jgi:hypothetical protein
MADLMFEKSMVKDRIKTSKNFKESYFESKNQFKSGNVLIDLDRGIGYVGHNIFMQTVNNKVIVSNNIYGMTKREKKLVVGFLNHFNVNPSLIVSAYFGLNQINKSINEFKNKLNDLRRQMDKQLEVNPRLQKNIKLLSQEIEDLKTAKNWLVSDEENQYNQLIKKNKKQEIVNEVQKLNNLLNKEKISNLRINSRKSVEEVLKKKNGKIVEVNSRTLGKVRPKQLFKELFFQSNVVSNWDFKIKNKNFEICGFIKDKKLNMLINFSNKSILVNYINSFEEIFNRLEKEDSLDKNTVIKVLNEIELLRTIARIWYFRPTKVIQNDILKCQNEISIFKTKKFDENSVGKFQQLTLKLADLFVEIQSNNSLLKLS